MPKSRKKKSRQKARRQAARKQQQTRRSEEGRAPAGAEPSEAGSRKAERFEKRETARQSRIEAVRKRKQAERRKRMRNAAIAAVLLSGLVLFFVLRGQRNKASLAADIEAAGCSEIETFKELPGVHIDTQQAPARTPYNSEPPTSGDHLGGYAPIWGEIDETLNPEQFVHNLEHGGTLVHYKDLDEEEIVLLQELAEEWGDKSALLMMPNPDVDKPVVMTAWAAKRSCERVSKPVIEAFMKERCNKSPEKLAGCGAVA